MCMKGVQEQYLPSIINEKYLHIKSFVQPLRLENLLKKVQLSFFGSIWFYGLFALFQQLKRKYLHFGSHQYWYRVRKASSHFITLFHRCLVIWPTLLIIFYSNKEWLKQLTQTQMYNKYTYIYSWYIYELSVSFYRPAFTRISIQPQYGCITIQFSTASVVLLCASSVNTVTFHLGGTYSTFILWNGRKESLQLICNWQPWN